MIRKVKIENFRSIKNESIVLPKFGAIIGKNASGKSNFISAISLLKNLAGGMDLETAIGKIAPLSGELFYFNDHKSEADFEFTIDTVKNTKYIFSYKIVFRTINGTPKLSVDTENLVKVVEGDNQLIYRRDKEVAIDGSTHQQIPLKVEINKLMLSKYSQEDVADVTNTLVSYTIIDKFPEYTDGLRIVDGNKPDTNSIDGLAVSLLTKDRKLFESAVNSVQKIIPNFGTANIVPLAEDSVSSEQNDKTEKDLKKFFVTWVEKVIPLRYSHVSLSNGDRRVIHLIFSLFNTTESSFLAAEEIENGMHFERLSRLIDQFRTQANNRKIQVLFTTHSNEILKKLTVDEVMYCRNNKDEGTRLVPITDTKEYESIKTDLRGDHTAADVIESGLFD